MVAKKKPRKSRASGVTVAARRVKRSAAKHGVKLSAAQIAEARRERVYAFRSDPLETRAENLARQRSYSPELRAMLASRPNYEGTNFDPRRFDASRTHDRFMSQSKLPLRNPSIHLPPRPSDTASHVAWDKYMENVDAMPVSFDGQPAYVRELWNLTAMGFGKVSDGGTLATFLRSNHGDVWRKFPVLKDRSSASIRIHEDGSVVALRSPVKNPSRKRRSARR